MPSFYHPARPARSLRVAALLLLAAAASAAPARAAELRVDRPCYADPADRADVVQLSGRGFAPGAAYAVTLDGRPLAAAAGRTTAAGTLSTRLRAPAVPVASRAAGEHAFRLAVVQGATRSATRVRVARLLAGFRPGTGDPRSLRVRFALHGFGLLGAVRPPAYLHYVGPSGRLVRTARLGTAGGACGSLRTARRRLFAFAPRAGTWALQFDTRRRYAPGGSRSPFLFYRVRVRVR